MVERGQEALRRTLNPVAITGREQVEQQPADGRYDQRFRIGVGALSADQGFHPIGDHMFQERRELLRSLQRATVDREEQSELCLLLRVEGPGGESLPPSAAG
jgi:hypothetical protein